jgi:hypothetical protein
LVCRYSSGAVESVEYGLIAGSWRQLKWLIMDFRKTKNQNSFRELMLRCRFCGMVDDY